MRRKVFEGRAFDVSVGDGTEIVEHGPAVAIVAEVDGHVVLVRQHREPIGGALLELPAGGVEEGESPLDTAKRELAEETGLTGGEWRRLASAYTSPGFCDELMHIFVATGLDEGEPSPEGDEELELVRWPVGEIEPRLDELRDAKTLAGLLLYLRER